MGGRSRRCEDHFPREVIGENIASEGHGTRVFTDPFVRQVVPLARVTFHVVLHDGGQVRACHDRFDPPHAVLNDERVDVAPEVIIHDRPWDGEFG